jgi:hypothetical protein
MKTIILAEWVVEAWDSQTTRQDLSDPVRRHSSLEEWHTETDDLISRVPWHQMLTAIDDMDRELGPKLLEQSRPLEGIGPVFAAEHE